MPKIETLDGAGFWKNAYAHQRGKLLKKVNVPEDQIIELVNKKYMEIPAALRYEIETSGINKKDLQWNSKIILTGGIRFYHVYNNLWWFCKVGH